MTDPRPFDAVLFDFGGTLFGHTTGPQLVKDAADAIGTELEPGAADDIWAEIDRAAMDPEEVALGRDLDATVWRTRWTVLYGVADRVAAGLGAAIDRSMYDPWSWIPHADAVPALESLGRAGVPAGVVSNTGWDVRTPFEVRGLDRLVTSFVLSCEAGAVKPDVAIFRAACAAVGSEPERTLFVGDNPVTDGGAVAAGLSALVVPSAPLGEAHGLLGALRLTGVDLATD